MAVENRKKLTPVFDWATGEFVIDPQGRVVTATGAEAVEQIATKALQTPRGVFVIYAAPGEPQRNHKYGSDVPRILTAGLDEATLESEIIRATTEALIYDPFITSVNDVTLTKVGTNEMETTADIRSIFDANQVVKGVTI